MELSAPGLPPQDQSDKVMTLGKTALDTLSPVSLLKELQEGAKTFVDLAGKGTIKFLLGIGALAMAIAAAMNWYLAARKDDASGAIWLAAFGLLLIVAGASFDIYTYYREMNAYEEAMKSKNERDKVYADLAKSGMQTLAGISQTVGASVQQSTTQMSQPSGDQGNLPKRG
jgi:hypothetical protein